MGFHEDQCFFRRVGFFKVHVSSMMDGILFKSQKHQKLRLEPRESWVGVYEYMIKGFLFFSDPFFPTQFATLAAELSQPKASSLRFKLRKANCHCFHTIENLQPHAYCHVLSPHWGTPTRAPACAFTATHAYSWVTHWPDICVHRFIIGNNIHSRSEEFKTHKYDLS